MTMYRRQTSRSFPRVVVYLLGPCPKTLRRKQLSLGKMGFNGERMAPCFSTRVPISWPVWFGQSVWLLSYNILMYSISKMPQNRFVFQILQGLSFRGEIQGLPTCIISFRTAGQLRWDTAAHGSTFQLPARCEGVVAAPGSDGWGIRLASTDVMKACTVCI